MRGVATEAALTATIQGFPVNSLAMVKIDDSKRADELGRFFVSLKDRPLEPDDPAYVPGVHVEESGDPINDLARQIAWDQGGGTYLFTGQRGTGKSTELRRLRRDLRAQG